MTEEKSSPLLTDRFHQALSLASSVHATQNRKGGTIPYISHLLGVCAIVLKAGGSENQAIAGLLHDAIEDQEDKLPANKIEKYFGSEVLRMVQDCTDETNETRKTISWQVRKQNYLDHLPGIAQETRLVILADKLDNLRDIHREYGEQGDKIWQKFSGKRSGTGKFYLSLMGILSGWQNDFLHEGNMVAFHLINEFKELCQNLFAAPLTK